MGQDFCPAMNAERGRLVGFTRGGSWPALIEGVVAASYGRFVAVRLRPYRTLIAFERVTPPAFT